MNDGSCWSRASRGSARRRCRPRSLGRRSRTARSWCTGAATRTSASPTSRGPRCSPTSSVTHPTTCSRRTSVRGGASWRGSRPDLARRATAGRTSSSDAESERYLLFGAVVDLLARVSAMAPLVLVLDDLHWADRPTVQLLRHVVSADASASTVRDRDVPRLRPRRPITRSPRRSRRCTGSRASSGSRCAASATTSSSPCSRRRPATRWPRTGVALRDALLAETDGNPFFVGEMLRHLAETGAIYQDEHGRWVASPDLRTSGLPISIREVIGRRVARLGAPTRACAVAGRGHRPRLRRRGARPGHRARRGHRHRPVRPGRHRGGAHRGRRGRPVHVRARADRARALRRPLRRPAGARPPDGRRRRSSRSVATIPASGSESSPTTGRRPPSRRTRARRSRTRNGRAIGRWPSSHPTRRCAGTGMRSICWTGPPPTTRAAGPRCSSGSATRNDRPVIPRTARRCSRPAASPTTSTRSTSSCAPRCGTTEGGTASSVAVDHDRVEMLKRALVRLGDADSPDRARLLALLCVERTWDADFDERLSMANQAVDIARRTGDDAALVDAIRLCHESITMPADPRAPPATGPPRRATSPTISATRSHASTPTTTGRWRRWRRATSRRCGRAYAIFESRVRADRTTAQPVADRLPPGVAADARRRPRRRRAGSRPKP